MASSKYYAVRRGKKTGILRTWDECRASTSGYPGAQFKSFGSVAEAEEWLAGDGPCTGAAKAARKDALAPAPPYAFVDGSYNAGTRVSGYGGFLVDAQGMEHPVTGSVTDPGLTSMRNVAGEIAGSEAAIRTAISLGIRSLDLYYDYEGIRAWADGSWTANKPGTIVYRDFIRSVNGRISIRFVKVAAHTGIPGNERADAMAKAAAGIRA